MKNLRTAWLALLVNLLVGIPAMVPLYSLWWLSERRWGGSVIDRSSTIIEVCGADCDRAAWPHGPWPHPDCWSSCCWRWRTALSRCAGTGPWGRGSRPCRPFSFPSSSSKQSLRLSSHFWSYARER